MSFRLIGQKQGATAPRTPFMRGLNSSASYQPGVGTDILTVTGVGMVSAIQMALNDTTSGILSYFKFYVEIDGERNYLSVNNSGSNQGNFSLWIPTKAGYAVDGSTDDLFYKTIMLEAPLYFKSSFKLGFENYYPNAITFTFSGFVMGGLT